MKDYWLAKLIASVGEVNSRKRLQKAIYLLQLAGCPLQCDYILHYYGPYSFELAGLMDQLEGADIIKETPEQLGTDVVRYKTKIALKGRKAIISFEKTESGKHISEKITPFIPRFETLNGEDLWILELAATVAYFHQNNWAEAQKQTASFKGVVIHDTNLKKAVKLARSFKKSA